MPTATPASEPLVAASEPRATGLDTTTLDTVEVGTLVELLLPLETNISENLIDLEPNCIPVLDPPLPCPLAHLPVPLPECLLPKLSVATEKRLCKLSESNCPMEALGTVSSCNAD